MRDRQEYLRRYYQANKLRKNENAVWRAQLLTQMLRWYKASHPCIDCGEADPIVLQFDHVRGKKLFTIGRHTRAKAIKRIWKEIQKCEVRCANCHIRRTLERIEIRGSVE